MLGFFPHLLRARSVVDPEALAADFTNAAQVAAKIGPHQWLDGAFPAADRELFAPEQHVWVREVGAQVPTGTTDTAPPLIGDGVGDPDLWYIPYNRGFSEVGDGDTALQWTATYPETVLIAFTFQYMRFDIVDFPDYDPADYSTHRYIRAQLMLEVDGARIPGTGPFGVLGSSWRTTGLGTRACRSTLWTVQHLPAGPHRVTPVGGQAPCVRVDESETANSSQVVSDDVSNGVCIANRRLVIVGFPRGARLSA